MSARTTSCASMTSTGAGNLSPISHADSRSLAPYEFHGSGDCQGGRVNEPPEEQQQFWNDAGGDNTWEGFYELEDVHYAMIEEMARGESGPENATVFVMESIRPVTGAGGRPNEV
jgi:hypothetical protein